jgi:hypothetical protein
MAVAVFLDTMVYLHYRPVDQIDWRLLLDEVDVVLVLPRVTVQELDKHKNTHKQHRIRERARRVLTSLDAWSATGEVKPGMKLEFRHAFPAVDFKQLGLRDDWNDDILLGAILDYQAQTEQNMVVLFTQETALRMTAQQIGIHVRSLDDGLRLPNERDPVEIERDDLRRQLEKVAGARPKVSLQFVSDGLGSEHGPSDRLVVVLRTTPTGPERDLHVAVDRERQRLLALVGPTKEPSDPVAASASAAYRALAQFSGGVSPDERARYLRDVNNYLPAYESFLREDAEFERGMVRRAVLSFQLVNTGTAPAEDVDIELHFPDGFDLLKPDEVAVKPAAPKSPNPPRSMLEVTFDSMRMGLKPVSYLSDYSGVLGRVGKASPSNVSGLKITRSNSYDVHLHVRRVKHGYRQPLGDLIIEFEDPSSTRPFHIDYWLRPANLPDAVRGQLHVLVQSEP